MDGPCGETDSHTSGLKLRSLFWKEKHLVARLSIRLSKWYISNNNNKAQWIRLYICRMAVNPPLASRPKYQVSTRHCFFVTHNYVLHLLHCKFIRLVKVSTFTLFAVTHFNVFACGTGDGGSIPSEVITMSIITLEVENFICFSALCLHFSFFSYSGWRKTGVIWNNCG
jgi:hypothetical protein